MTSVNKVIISLLVANLIATVWFGLTPAKNPSSQIPMTESVKKHELPNVISSSVKAELLNTFIAHYNDQDYSSLYNMFGPVAQSQLSEEQMLIEFKKMTKFFGNVESGSFKFAEFSSQHGSSLVYILNYNVRLSDKSEFGENGDLKITIAVEGDDFQVYGIRLNGGMN